MAGYSKTPLAQKLGIKTEHRVCLLGAPDGFDKSLAPLPPDIVVARTLRGTKRFGVIVYFSKSVREMEARLEALKARLEYAGGLWLCWPKKSSGVATDLSDGLVRMLGLRAGLVDNKTCAVDETWSGLRFVYRVKDRPKG